MKSILLPLFSNPVKNGIKLPQQAYAYGKEHNLVDPAVSQGKRSFIESVAESIKACSVATSTAYKNHNQQNGTRLVPDPINLTVLGYATKTALTGGA